MALNHMVSFTDAKHGKKAKPVRSAVPKAEVRVEKARKERTAPPSVEKGGSAKRGRPSGSPYAGRTPVLIKLDPEMVEWLDAEYVRRKQPSRVDLIRAILGEARSK